MLSTRFRALIRVLSLIYPFTECQRLLLQGVDFPHTWVTVSYLFVFQLLTLTVCFAIIALMLCRSHFQLVKGKQRVPCISVFFLLLQNIFKRVLFKKNVHEVRILRGCFCSFDKIIQTWCISKSIVIRTFLYLSYIAFTV